MSSARFLPVALQISENFLSSLNTEIFQISLCWQGSKQKTKIPGLRFRLLILSVASAFFNRFSVDFNV